MTPTKPLSKLILTVLQLEFHFHIRSKAVRIRTMVTRVQDKAIKQLKVTVTT